MISVLTDWQTRPGCGTRCTVEGSLLTAGADRSRSRIIPTPARAACKHSSDSRADVQTLPGHQHQDRDIWHPLINLVWAEARGFHIFCVGQGEILFSIQHPAQQHSTYICSFYCCFDIPWNLKDPLFNYSNQGYRPRVSSWVKGFEVKSFRCVFFHLKIQSFISKFKHLSLPTLEHLAE